MSLCRCQVKDNSELNTADFKMIDYVTYFSSLCNSLIVFNTPDKRFVFCKLCCLLFTLV